MEKAVHRVERMKRQKYIFTRMHTVHCSVKHEETQLRRKKARTTLNKKKG